MSEPKISVIIVNYNVKDFLEQALLSLKRALQDITSEIIVVDNNSIDGSVQMLRERFPDVALISNEKNLGFSAANNLGIKQTRGEFVVLLNPDTVVSEDTFTKLLDFFNKTPDASAATCKILNPDGSFSVDCRHSIPTPSIAFWKLIGLSKLFPKSKIFGRYNLTYLNENETYPVEAISGSFMMIKKKVVDKIGLLDDTFFMYCEDIDYCHRINLEGGKIYYVPDAQIIHYKGESTKANNLDYVITFNKSLYLFYKKHYQQKYIYPFKWLILLGVILRGIFIYFRNNIKRYFPVILDLLFLNIVIFLSFWVRFSYKHSFSIDDFLNTYIIINLITSVVFIFNTLAFDIVKRNRFSPEKVFKVLFTTFLIVAALTAFLKELAFSRFVVLISAFFSTIVLIGWRFIFSLQRKKYATALAKEFLVKKAVIVGEDKETRLLLDKLNQRLDSNLDILGVASTSREKIGTKIGDFTIVTSLDQLPEYARLRKVSLLIFSTHSLSYETVLQTMTRLRELQVEFKMVPGHMEFMIGKSNIERLDSVPLIEIDYAYGRPFNRLVKRSFDLVLALTLFLLLIPAGLILLFKRKRKKIILSVGKSIRIYPKNGILQLFSLLPGIISGKISFVGAPLENNDSVSKFEYKPGITGILQINKQRIHNDQVKENFELHYLKNQSFFLDLEILFKSVFK